MTHHITITRNGNTYTADCPTLPGSPYVGRGSTAKQALGEWVAFNRDRLGITIEEVCDHVWSSCNSGIYVCGNCDEQKMPVRKDDPIEEEEEERQPIIVNQSAPGDLKIGDYVFASRWSDCDPGDPWHVGPVSEIGEWYVIVGDVSQRRWPKAMKITQEQGKRICEQFPGMEKYYKPFNYEAIAKVFAG